MGYPAGSRQDSKFLRLVQLLSAFYPFFLVHACFSRPGAPIQSYRAGQHPLPQVGTRRIEKEKKIQQKHHLSGILALTFQNSLRVFVTQRLLNERYFLVLPSCYAKDSSSLAIPSNPISHRSSFPLPHLAGVSPETPFHIRHSLKEFSRLCLCLVVPLH